MTDKYGKIHTDGSRSGGQPVVAQHKALAVANKLLGIDRATLGELSHQELMMALVLIVQQSEAFKQEVSDAVEGVLRTIEGRDVYNLKYPLSRFIISKPKPDPLEDAIRNLDWLDEYDAERIRIELDALGFEIREKESK